MTTIYLERGKENEKKMRRKQWKKVLVMALCMVAGLGSVMHIKAESAERATKTTCPQCGKEAFELLSEEGIYSAKYKECDNPSHIDGCEIWRDWAVVCKKIECKYNNCYNEKRCDWSKVVSEYHLTFAR